MSDLVLKGRGFSRADKLSKNNSGALQVAEKLHWRSGLYQGTSSLVPKRPK
jgi:hypothetical protein